MDRTDATYDPAVGWIALPNLLALDEITDVLAECDQLLSLPAEDRSVGDKPVAGTRHLMELDHRVPLIDEIASRPRLVAELRAILGQQFSRRQVSYRCPQPGYGSQQLHTDDLPKRDTGPDRVATAIIALTDFTAENGPTRVVPGSHQRPDLQRQAGSLQWHPDEVQMIGAAGTAFVFSGHLLHSGTMNRSTADRPALQLTWVSISPQATASSGRIESSSSSNSPPTV